MVEAWFAIFWLMATAYVVLEGRTLGASALRLVVASSADERRQVLDAIGLLWTWHEVLLVGVGGVLLLAFPAVLATAFSGYYLALFLILWLLILRGISIEFGQHLDHSLWRSFWDVVLAASSAVLMLLLGVAFGNILRGIPLDTRSEFQMAFFTDFGVRGHVGLLDWYTLSIGAFASMALSAHGATYLMGKTAGAVQERSRVLGRRLWRLTLALGIVAVLETQFVRPDLWSALVSRPLPLLFLLVAAAGAVAVFRGYRSGRDRWAFPGSCALIAGVLGARAAAAFPVLLFSTLDPEHSISAYQVATRHHSLAIALAWWAVGAPLAVLWYALARRSFRGTVPSDR